ncbi:MAG: hypothetical protein C0617_14335 [Desulfuromonas sp.]|uniref:hypothetical protein n=1 Tax=Desulfuromonas sp. TaxID=892 RepID=UPI000CB9943B|nr:hypothetical protein [Desulfuromonas sp.]PLX82301.1 MAG: hypothetical protein C0617_14335 [Desulfuromonas sp.]
MRSELFETRTIQVRFDAAEWWRDTIPPALDQITGSPLFWPALGAAAALVLLLGFGRRRAR